MYACMYACMGMWMHACLSWCSLRVFKVQRVVSCNVTVCNVMACMIMHLRACFFRSPYVFVFVKAAHSFGPSGTWWCTQWVMGIAQAAQVFPHVWFLLRQGQHLGILSSSIPLREGRFQFFDGAKRKIWKQTDVTSMFQSFFDAIGFGRSKAILTCQQLRRWGILKNPQDMLLGLSIYSGSSLCCSVFASVDFV